MRTRHRTLPSQIPVLSRGKHRSPRTGACFMEMASYLAGERWSDHPACTHPLLALVARGVNDYTSDDGRQRLAVLIPSVIGTAGDDVRIDARIALACAMGALPVVAAERQRVMAVGLLTCERMLNALERRPADDLSAASRAALGDAPHAAEWAYRYAADQQPSPKAFRKYAAPAIVGTAIKGIAESCVRDRDQVFHDVLVDAIRATSWYTARKDRPEPRAGESKIVAGLA